MANRVYLYSIDKEPFEKASLRTMKAKGLYEFNHEIPLAACILAGAKYIKTVSSLIFNSDVNAFISDYNSGYNLMMEFLNAYLLSTVNKAHNHINKSSINKISQFLIRQKGAFVHSEFAEISVMHNTKTNKEANKYSRMYIEMAEKNCSLLRKHLNKNNIDEFLSPNGQHFITHDKLSKNFSNAIGLDEFSNTLYYS